MKSTAIRNNSAPSSDIFQLSLRRRAPAALFLLAILVPGVLLVVKTARVALAATWGDSVEPAPIERALRLDSANPELHFNLGTSLLWGETSDPPAAVRELRLATTLNPNAARYWSALGKACFTTGDAACADQAFERATELAPSKPRFAWEAAVNAAVTSRPETAIAHLNRFVKLQPENARQAFDLLLRAFHDSDLIWRGVVRDSSALRVQLAFLEFLVESSRVDDANQYWPEVSRAHPAIPAAAAKSFVERLLGAGRYREAGDVWKRLQFANADSDSARSAPNNLVFNGGFEQEPLNGGFDWRYQPQTYVGVDFADRGAHTGSHALRVDFTVPANSDYEPVYQLVSVVPGQTYAFTGYARSDRITSDSGPRLRVSDPQCSTCLNAFSDGVTGTTDWHALEVRFVAPPTAEVVRVSVWRPRSRSFPQEISGQFWLDDVTLRPIATATVTGVPLP